MTSKILVSSKKLILLHLDALSWKFLQDGYTPHLRSILQSGIYGKLNSGLMYEGITASMFTGVWPNQHDVWTHFIRDKDKSAWKNFGWLSKFESRPFSERCESKHFYPILLDLSFRVLSKIGINHHIWRYHKIPLEYRAQFAYSLPNYNAITQYDYFGKIPTLFKILRENGYKTFDLFGELKSLKEQILNEQLLKKYDVLFIHTLMDLDQMAHKFGPDDIQTISYVQKQDEEIQDFFKKVSEVTENIDYVVFSDHGMTPVVGTIDVGSLIQDILEDKRLCVFVDSTMFRIWGTTGSVMQILKRFENIPKCKILKEEDLKILNINFSHDGYGNAIVLADEGYVFNPNFWEGYSKVRGMHGYDSTSDYLTSFIGIISDSVDITYYERRAELVDIFPTALRLLNISVPNSINGRSLIN